MRATKYVALALLLVLSLTLLLHGNLPQISSGTWTPANNLAEARSGSAAVVLDDGRVLFTGGTGSTGALTSAELFNTDGSISVAAPMLDPRTRHTAVMLKDGRVLVAGGTTSGGGTTSAAEIYDPAGNSWTAVPGGMTSPRSSHTASLLSDGRVLVAGGATTAGATNTLEVYSPDTNSFTAVTSGMLSSVRQEHAAAVLADGRILIAGGSDGAASLNSTDIFDPATGSVAAGPAMASARAGLSATTLLDGKVLLAGGNNGSADLSTAEVYNASTGSISATGGLATPRRDHLALLLSHNNGVLITGGSSAGAPLASAELFYPWTGAFTATGAMASPRTAAAGAALKQDGYLLVAGGSDGTNPLAATELYGFATIKTDKADYAPGEIVTISGTGWQPGETVTLTLVESPLLDTHGPFTAVADSNGNISNIDFVPDEYDVSILFYLTATGSVSQAQTTFADSKPNTVNVGTQSPNPVAPGSSTAYTITVGFNGPNTSCTANLSVTTTLPTGATASFSPASVTSTGADQTSTLTISTTNATPPGSTTFTVQAAGTAPNCTGNNATGTGTLVVVENTTTTLASSVNPSVFGQSTTLTATVAKTSGPTTPNAGTVTFKDGANTLGTGTLNASGVATLAVSTLTAGSHSLTASYAGVTNTFGASTSNTVSQTVNQAGTTTTVTSSQNPSVFGQSVTFTATVAAVSPGSGTATGTVTFKDGATTIGTGTLNGAGQATFATSSLSVAAHSITASYGGDTSFTGSTSPALTQTVNQADTTTTLTSATNPSVFGQSVTFTATVAATVPGAGTPTGTVTFKDGATTLGTGTLNGSGQATFATSSLTVSGHSIAAVYGSDTNFKTSTSGILTQTVNKASTTTTVSSATNPSTFGQSVTFTATVAAVAPGAGTPTGTVTFKDGATTLGTGTLDGTAQATFSTSSLTTGSHPTITAVYGSDLSFNTSTSAALTQTVNKANTTTSVATSGTPTVFGQSVTFTATVAAVLPATDTPTGTVTFKDGATTIGTGPLNGSGVATFSTPTLSVTGSPHSITAVYGTDTNFNGSTSAAITQTVGAASTATALTASPNPSVFGQSVTFTATVTAVAPGAGTPTGTVTFKDGATTLGPGTLNGSGVATFSTTALSVAGSPHSVTAVYATDGNFATSTSPAVSQVVNKASSVTTLTSSANPSVFGQSVTFTATVAAVAPGSGAPTGTVTFKDGATVLGTGPLNGAGVATFGISSLSVATHPITAVYGADTNFNGSTSAALNQVVNKANTSTVVTSSPSSSTYGQSVTLTATVTAVAPGTGTPTGSAQFFDVATSLGTGTLNGSGVATLTTTALSVGSHNDITAVFTNGDGNFNGSTSPAISQSVSMGDSFTTMVSSLNPSLFGQSVTFTATVTYGSPAVLAANGCVTFMDGGATLANNVMLNASGQAAFTTTTLTSGSHNIQANFKDQGAGCNADNNLKNSNASLTQTVNQAPAITSANSTTFTVGAAGSFTVTATGFPAPTLSETGALPSGVTFNASTGVLSGSPVAGTGGAYAISFTAANGIGTNATQNFTLNVNQTSAITSANSTTFTAGTLGSFTVTTTGFPKPSLTKSGSLPSGVSFTDNGNGTASLSGTATSAGSFPITITAHNGVGGDATQIFTLTVNAGALDHLTLSPASATIFAGGSQPYTATGSDQYGNTLGDVTGTTTFSIAPDGGCTMNSCSATVAGVHTVTGTNSGKTGTASLTVTPGPTAALVLSPASTTIAAGASQSYTAQGVDSYLNSTGDVTSSTTFSITPDGSCTAASCTANIAGPHTVTGNYSGKTGTASLTVTAGDFAKLQLLVPGETAAPGTPSGKTGTPQTEYVNGVFNVTVNAVDASWNVVSSVTDTVQITSTDAHAHLPSNAALVLGTGTFSVTLVTESHDPATTKLTATDVTDSTKASDTSPAITVIVAYTASISPSSASDGASSAYTLTVNNAIAPNTNTLRSVTVAIPTNGGTPSLVSVTAANPGPTPANWSVDLSQLPSYLRFTQNTLSDGVGPGGTISIQFTTTANESVTTAIVQEVWTTTAFSNADYTGPLPLAGSEPTVTIGKAPAITSTNSVSFTVGVAGNFTVTTTGVPKPTLSKSGALPNGVTFTDNGDGTGTLSGTPTTGTAGAHPITFAATNGIPPDATQAFTLTVINPATTTTLASSKNPSTYGDTVTFTATVSFDSSAGTPNGNVQFKTDGSPLGAPVPVTSCGANKVCATSTGISTLTVPSHTITADYGADTVFLASTGSLTQTVNQATPTVNVTGGTFIYDGNPHPATGSVTGVNGSDLGTPTFTYNGSPGAPVNAGSYAVVASFAGNTNYRSASANANITINQAPATVMLDHLTQTYTGLALTPTATTTPAGLTVNLTNAPQINANSYLVTATISDTNYTGSATATFVILPATALVVVTDPNVMWTGSPQSATINTTPSGLAYTATYTGTGQTTYTASTTPPTDPGTYAVSVNVTDQNYFGSVGAGTLTINNTDATTPSTVNPLYDFTAKSASTDATVVFDTVSTRGITSISTVAAPAPVDTTKYKLSSSPVYYDLATNAGFIGNIQVCLVYTADNFLKPANLVLLHYNSGTHEWDTTASTVDQPHTKVCGAVTSLSPFTVVENISTTTTLTVDPAGPTYGTQITLTAAVTPSDATGTVQFYDGGNTLGSPVSVSGGQAQLQTSALTGGSHSITATYVPANYYNGSTSATVIVIVKKADATINVTPYSVTYDSNPHTATGTATGVGGADLSSFLNLSGTTHTNAGIYTGDAWSFAGGTNYNDASGTVNDLIKKATATINVTPYSVTYDGNPHTATGTAIGVKSESLSGLDLSGTTHTNAGDYPSDPWTFTDVTGNYKYASGTVHDNIAKATPTITWANPADITYGTALSGTQLNATFTWVVSGSTVTVPGTATYTPLGGTVLNTANGQNLKVDFTPTDTTNYYTATKTVQINVLKATPTVTWANPADITYGTALSGTQLNATFTWVVNGSTVTVPGTATYTPLGGTVLNAGNNQNLHVYLTPADTTNYNGISKDVKINVQPAPLSITASSSPMTYGGPVPPIIAGYSGFVNGESAANLTTQPVCLTLATSASPVGTYASSCSGAVDNNYTITYVPGVVTVNPATTATSVTSSPNPSNWTQMVTFTATVAPQPQYSQTPTGTVTFYNAASGATCSALGTSTLIDAPTLVNGVATTGTSTLLTGTDTILACYSGDGNFISSSGTVAQTVIPAPIAMLSPDSLSFGNQQAGTTSGPQPVIISNPNGTAPLNITSITLTGTNPTYFTQTNSCTSVPAGGSCTITVKFAPPANATGVATATLVVTDNDRNISGSIQSSLLTGAGTSTISSVGSLSTYAIFATANGCSSINGSGGIVVDSFNSSLGYASHQNSGGNVGTNGNVSLSGSNTIIYGSASTPIAGSGNCGSKSMTGYSANGGATATGGQIPLSQPVTYPAPPAPNPAPPTSNQGISGSCGSIPGCANNGTKNVMLNPGLYGNLSLSGGTTAHILAGTYNMNSLTLSGNSTLVVDSVPVIVNLGGNSLSGGNTVLDLSGGSMSNSSGIPSNLQFYYAGSRPIKLSGGAGSYAVVYAPNSPINLSGGSHFYGGIVGSTINDSGGTAIHYDNTLPAINAGNYIWFNSAGLNVKGLPSTGSVKLFVTNASITFTANGTPYSLAVPNAVITFSSTATAASTTWDTTNNRWNTLVPTSMVNGNATIHTFLDGLAYQVPTTFPGGIQNAKWSAAYSTDSPGISFQWQWGAAVYNSFSTTYPSLGVNPADNADPAGTPINYKSALVFGATGAGPTGLYVGTAGVVPTIAPASVSPSSLDFGTLNVNNTSTSLTAVLTNNQSGPLTIASIQITGTNSGDFNLTPINPCPSTMPGGSSCNITVMFKPNATGKRTAKIAVNDDANNSPQTVFLKGAGQ